METRLHLPDCISLRSDMFKRRECDCGRPDAPMSHSKTIVRRHTDARGGPQLVVVPKSQVRDGERDLGVSRLQFEADTRSWIRQQLAADERKARLTSSGKDVWS